MDKIISLATKAGKVGKDITIVTLKSGPAIVSADAFADSAVKVTGVTNPFEVSKIAFKMVARRCLPPEYYVFGEGVTLGAYIYAFIISGGSWTYTAVFLWLYRFVFEKEA